MRKRSVRLSFILCIIGGLLLLRLMWVQIIEGHHYEEMALNQTEGVQTLYSPRGTIYDRNGRELAFSIMVKSFYADPGTMNVSPEEAAKELAPLLAMTHGQLTVKAHSDWADKTSKKGLAYSTGSAQISIIRDGFTLPVYLKAIIHKDKGMTTYTLLAADQASGAYFEPVVDKALAGAGK